VVDATTRPLDPRKESQYPLHRRIGEGLGRSGRVRKISPPPKFDHRIVQPAASRYKDYAIPAHKEGDGRRKRKPDELV